MRKCGEFHTYSVKVSCVRCVRYELVQMKFRCKTRYTTYTWRSVGCKKCKQTALEMRFHCQHGLGDRVVRQGGSLFEVHNIDGWV